MQSIAATAAFQFDTNDLNALRVEKDWQKPEWAKVVNQLKEIRESNPGVLYAYIFRKSKTDPSKLEFVSDSHSLNPYANLDNDPTNDINIGPDDGKFDPYGEELLQWPGQPYDSAPKEAYEAFAGPTSNQDFYTDKWGTVVSGYAPIRDSKGDVTAVIAVDIDAQAFGRLNQNG